MSVHNESLVPSVVRVTVRSDAENRLLQESWLMADKLMTVPRNKLGRRIGQLDDETMMQLGNAIVVFLGLSS